MAMRIRAFVMLTRSALLSLALMASFAPDTWSAQPTSAQPTPAPPTAPAPMTGAAVSKPSAKGDPNTWTVGLAGGLLEGSFIRYAADLAKVLDDGDNLRVIPMVTYGAVGNVSDLLRLHGVDVAITQSDVLEYFKTELATPRLAERVNYIAPLFQAEVHVCAKPEFKSLADLSGKRVAFNTHGSAANLTGQIVFRRLNIPVQPVFINNSVALEQMKASDLAAVVHVVAKPNDLFASYKGEVPCRFLPVAYGKAFEDFYVPTLLEARDYPAFIPAGQSVATLAVPAVLAVYNWPRNSERGHKVARFIEAFFTKFEQLQQPPFQPKWKEINIAGTVPGWTRYPVAEEILARLSSADDGRTRSKFESFLAQRRGGAPLTQKDREALFKDFLDWQRH